MGNSIWNLLQAGTVIPAQPLALTKQLNIDEAMQRQLTRYYIASGAGGLAVGVHSTQFEIRKKGIDLYEPVLRIASEEINAHASSQPFIKVAGICGPTEQALDETDVALQYGYNLGLLSPGGLQHFTETQLIDRAAAVAEKIPLFGFYLQPAVGGRVLSYDFWKAFASIPNVKAIKIAAFNRYQTLDAVRGVCESSRNKEIALYTGNDDNIVADLLTPYRIKLKDQTIEKRFVGGLLGHWAVWTKAAVQLLKEIKHCVNNNYFEAEDLLAKNIAVTHMNAAIFDVKHSFKGCIAGIHYVLHQQGLMKEITCLNPEEKLSPGQQEEIDWACSLYPELTDDDFVKTFLHQ